MYFDFGFQEACDLLTKNKGNHFIIGLETAASRLGISDGWLMPLTIFSEDDKDIPEGVQVILVKKLDRTDLLTIKGIQYTSIERTICDMLMYHRDQQTIVESMCHYYHSVEEQNSWGKLPHYAERRGVLHLLESFYNDAILHAEY